MKIYTRTGDDGTTSLFAGGRVPKASLRVEAYGTTDELNAHLGMARALKPQRGVALRLVTIQTQLFHLGADLATPMDAKASFVVRVEQSQVDQLEAEIDVMTAELPELTRFILPGGTPAAAQIHIARTVCRRAERLVVSLAEVEPINAPVLPYLNRLSDYLFTLARWENHQAGIDDEVWAVR